MTEAVAAFVHLTLFNTRIIAGKPKLLERHDLRWLRVNGIDTLEFCLADREIPERLKEGKGFAAL